VADKRKDRKKKRREKRKERSKQATARRSANARTKKRNPIAESLAAYVTMETLVGRRITSADLRSFARNHGWRQTFAVLANLAARLAVAPNDTRAELLASVASLSNCADPLIARAVQALSTLPGLRVVAHEQLIYFLQALVLLEGGDNDIEPSEASVVVWMIAANDHLHGWGKDDARRLTEVEAMVAEFAHVSRFNIHDDDLRALTRTALMFSRRPEHAKLGRKEETWAGLQHEAFGDTFMQRFRQFYAPLFMFSTTWGRSRADGTREPPSIARSSWAAATQLPAGSMREFLTQMATDRGTAQTALRESVGDDGLPHAPTLFYRTPFVLVSDDVQVAASPWAVRAQARTGIYMKFSQAAKRLRYDDNDWPAAFGYLFERWCADVARMAAAESNFKEQLIVPAHPGATDEIEDVVTVHGGAICMFSAKGRLVAEPIARRAVERASVLDWYEKFFFGSKDTRDGRAYRDGAVHLLDARIDQIRSGAFKDRVAPNVEIFPALLTFDQLGESPVMYRWLHARCAAEGLLQ